MLIIIISTLLSCILAPMGAISLWKRYIYFTDALAHTSLLVGVINIMTNIPVIYSGLFVAILFAILVFKLQKKTDNNVAITMISSGMLSVAILYTHLNKVEINIKSLLFGNINNGSIHDLIMLTIMLIIIVIFILKFYNQIILGILNKEIAKLHGNNIDFIELIFLILLSLSVFVTMKIVGMMLVMSILLIPPVTAKLFSSTPLQMIIYSILIAFITNLIGLGISFYFLLPVAPVIIIIGFILYCSCVLICKKN